MQKMISIEKVFKSVTKSPYFYYEKCIDTSKENFYAETEG